MRTKFALMFFGVVLISLILVSAQSTNPWSVNAQGVEKNEFDNFQKIYVKSNALCQPATVIDLYVIENKDSWTGGEGLTDVRGKSQEITLVSFKIPTTLIWETPKTGDYDIVVDCDRDGKYTIYTDQVDSFETIGFSVASIPGTGTAKKGNESMKAATWSYDPEGENNLKVGIMQLELTAVQEDLALNNISLVALGSGNEALIAGLSVYVDENSNGIIDPEEISIGDLQPAFKVNNGQATINLDYFLSANVPEKFIIAYTLSETVPEGEYYIRVTSIYGTGEVSEKTVLFIGLPIESGILEVMPPKSCTGELSLTITPNNLTKASSVTAIAGTTLSAGCNDKKIILQNTPCGSSGTKIDSCIIEEDKECKMDFTARSTTIYYACIDKNDDSDYSDFGESASAAVTITAPIIVATTTNITTSKPTEENLTNETEVITEENQTSAPVTGGIIDEIRSRISQAGSFFILLEATLLLILFVLVIISFRLRSRGVFDSEKKTEVKPEEAIKTEMPKPEETKPESKPETKKRAEPKRRSQ